MSLTTEFEEPQPAPLRLIAEKVRIRIDQVVAQVAHHAHQMEKHEIPITHSVAQALRSEFVHPIEVDGLRLRVDVEEFTPTQESRCGADLYISILRDDIPRRITKGMLIQSKRKVALKIPGERRRLRNQSGRMRRRSPSDSYVWVFREDGVQVTPAPKSSNPTLRDLPRNHQSVGDQIAQGILCNQGDRRLGPVDMGDHYESLRDALRRISAPAGLNFIVESTSHTSLRGASPQRQGSQQQNPRRTV